VNNNGKDDGYKDDDGGHDMMTTSRGGVQYVPSGALLLLAQRDSLAFFALFLSKGAYEHVCVCVCVTGNCHLKCILESRSVRREAERASLVC